MAALAPHIRTSTHSVPPHFVPIHVMALPAMIESAAHVAAVGEDLRLFINRPYTLETLQYVVDRDLIVSELPTIPIIVSSVSAAGNAARLTGASGEGAAIAMGLGEDGTVDWQSVIPGAPPIHWPEIGGADASLLAWQEAAGSLEVARIRQKDIVDRRSVPVHDGLVEAAITDAGVCAVWATRRGIEGVITETGNRQFRLDTGYPAELAIGCQGRDSCIAWLHGDDAQAAVLNADSLALGDPAAVDRAGAVDGTMAVVSGALPLVWCQRMFEEDDDTIWLSSLCIPGREPLVIEGLIHDVSWWGETLVVAGTVDIRFFRFTDTAAGRSGGSRD